jgi:uncharacterized membrane protein YgcG
VNAHVDNNTLYLIVTYANAIEFNYASTAAVLIRNNLVNKPITALNNANATLSTNVISALGVWFVNPSACDLHLARSVSGVVNSGTTIIGLTTDIDGDPRPTSLVYDIGADEYTGSSSSSSSSSSGSSSSSSSSSSGASGGSGGGSINPWLAAALAFLTLIGVGGKRQLSRDNA